MADKDHHSYLAFSTSGGSRKQVGAATVVEAAGKQMVIVYESRNGVPYIREVRVEGVAQAFLDGFKGRTSAVVFPSPSLMQPAPKVPASATPARPQVQQVPTIKP